MQRLLRHTIGGAVRIETRLDPRAGYGICDANQLENAILNLAINARDAMPEGGTLTIFTDRIGSDDEPDHPAGEFVRITVADTGHGMAPDVLARAAEPFYLDQAARQGHRPRPRPGLRHRPAGRRDPAHRQRGREGHVGPYPAAQRPPPRRGDGGSRAARAERSAAGGASGARVLVVDDDDDVRAFLAESLEGLGCTVVSAASGAEGLEAFATGGPTSP